MNQGTLAGHGGRFVSPEYPIPTSGTYANISANHGLGSVPSVARAVLVCKIAEVGYKVGDEVDIWGVWSSLASINAGVAANGATIYLLHLGGATAWSLTNLTSGALTSITKGNWRVKFYAQV